MKDIITIKLTDIPGPENCKSTKECRAGIKVNKNNIKKILRKLEELKYVWAGGLQKKPTEFDPISDDDSIRFLSIYSDGIMAYSTIDIYERIYEILDDVYVENKKYNSKCRKCGQEGDDIIFKFYCSNKNCEDYHQ